MNNCIAHRAEDTHLVDDEILSMPVLLPSSDTHGSSDGIEVAHLGGCLDDLTPSVQVVMGLSMDRSWGWTLYDLSGEQYGDILPKP